MSDFAIPTIDIVRELRLRQWAREHYVPENERLHSWHPVVLDEMHRRDLELLVRFITETMDAPEIAATPIESPKLSETIIANEPIQSISDAETTTAAEIHGNDLFIGSRFVPLDPSSHVRIDQGVNEIPRPHRLSIPTRALDLAVERNYR